jgi:DNA polymerase-3 subunit epsilon
MEEADGTDMRWATRSAGTARIDLRASWRNATYCAVDVETTGLDLRRDSIVSIGTACIRDGRIVCSDNYYSLIRPSCPVSVASIRIHCLRPADLENAPTATDVAQEVAHRLAGRVVIAHAAWIERALLRRLLRHADARFAGPVIDTAALARALGYARDSPHGREPSLELLARRLSLPVYAPHHALGDAVTTAAVFLALASRAAQYGTLSGPDRVSLQSLVRLSEKHANW